MAKQGSYHWSEASRIHKKRCFSANCTSSSRSQSWPRAKHDCSAVWQQL